MAQNWLPRLARGWVHWLTVPQPRQGIVVDTDADVRRMRAELDAVRTRFREHA
ncbi:MAG TPA: hypothetical protein VFW21_10600 [Mycobacterium sp.]|nr:hypothetical protein [Mycobacterium sp.]